MDESWPCHKCTFLNCQYIKYCEICGSEKLNSLYSHGVYPNSTTQNINNESKNRNINNSSNTTNDDKEENRVPEFPPGLVSLSPVSVSAGTIINQPPHSTRPAQSYSQKCSVSRVSSEEITVQEASASFWKSFPKSKIKKNDNHLKIQDKISSVRQSESGEKKMARRKNLQPAALPSETKKKKSSLGFWDSREHSPRSSSQEVTEGESQQRTSNTSTIPNKSVGVTRQEEMNFSSLLENKKKDEKREYQTVTKGPPPLSLRSISKKKMMRNVFAVLSDHGSDTHESSPPDTLTDCRDKDCTKTENEDTLNEDKEEIENEKIFQNSNGVLSPENVFHKFISTGNVTPPPGFEFPFYVESPINRNKSNSKRNSVNEDFDRSFREVDNQQGASDTYFKTPNDRLTRLNDNSLFNNNDKNNICHPSDCENEKLNLFFNYDNNEEIPSCNYIPLRSRGRDNDNDDNIQLTRNKISRQSLLMETPIDDKKNNNEDMKHMTEILPFESASSFPDSYFESPKESRRQIFSKDEDEKLNDGYNSKHKLDEDTSSSYSSSCQSSLSRSSSPSQNSPLSPYGSPTRLSTSDFENERRSKMIAEKNESKKRREHKLRKGFSKFFDESDVIIFVGPPNIGKKLIANELRDYKQISYGTLDRFDSREDVTDSRKLRRYLTHLSRDQSSEPSSSYSQSDLSDGDNSRRLADRRWRRKKRAFIRSRRFILLTSNLSHNERRMWLHSFTKFGYARRHLGFLCLFRDARDCVAEIEDKTKRRFQRSNIRKEQKQFERLSRSDWMHSPVLEVDGEAEFECLGSYLRQRRRDLK